MTQNINDIIFFKIKKTITVYLYSSMTQNNKCVKRDITRKYILSGNKVQLQNLIKTILIFNKTLWFLCQKIVINQNSLRKISATCIPRYKMSLKSLFFAFDSYYFSKIKHMQVVCEYRLHLIFNRTRNIPIFSVYIK